MKRLFVFAVLLLAGIALNGCGTPTAAPGDNAPPPVDPNNPVVASIVMTPTKTNVLTNGADASVVTVTALDSGNGLVANAVITISTTTGEILPSIVTTDATGKGTFTFTSGTEKSIAAAAVITATSGTAIRTLNITLTGTALTLSPSKTSTKLSDPSPIVITGKVVDGGGVPIMNAPLTLTSALGNRLTSGAANASTITVNSDASGTITATYTATSISVVPDTVTLTGMGATPQTVAITISNANFSFAELPPPSNIVAIGATKVLTVTWINADNTPHFPGDVNFTTNAGTLNGLVSNTATVATTAAGVASVTFHASGTAAPATVTATATDGVQTLDSQVILDVRATTPAKIVVQVAPSVIPPRVVDLVSPATITATVRDANNNGVAGQVVNFQLLVGPGGGEYISPGSAITDSGGVATSTFYSGTATSAQNGVVIAASVGGITTNTPAYPSVLNTTNAKLTIGQTATRISLGTTNKLRKVSFNGLEVAYALPISVMVTDNNNNPIPNAIVNLSAYCPYFYTGLGGDAQAATGQFANEDLNRNGILDAGEDGAVGEYPFLTPAVWYNGSVGNPADTTGPTPNGRLDPSGGVMIPREINTGTLGAAAFEVIYFKSVAGWLDVEIRGTTLISGSETSASLLSPLLPVEGDKPYPSSPYGF